MSMDRCSSPRPETLKVSMLSVSSTRMATFVSTSLKSRSRRFREVTNLPSRPAKGESFTLKSMETVGSSIFTKGSGSIWSVVQAVSPMFRSVMPETAMMSPNLALSASTLFRPSNWYSFEILAFLWPSSPPPQMATCWPTFISPRSTRPMPIRPTYSS